MHRVQRYVLQALIKNSDCRYRDIKPKDVEGNLFSYHLKSLTSSGLVKKVGSIYRLTTKGSEYVGRISSKDSEVRIQPKIVTLIVCRNQHGEYLLYQRRREPFRGLVGFPYGKVHLGEKVPQAAKRELQEKTGLEANLTHRGEAYLLVKKEGELLSHMLFHIFVGEVVGGELQKNSDIGECFWAKIETISEIKIMPGFQQIKKLVDNPNGQFFAEINEEYK